VGKITHHTIFPPLKKIIRIFRQNFIMVIYDSEFEYLDSKTDAKSKILAIDAIIDLLFTTAAKAALSEDVTEYWLDDGQTKIKTIRRSVASITASIQELRKLKNVYVQQINGRVVVLRDSKNFTSGNYRY